MSLTGKGSRGIKTLLMSGLLAALGCYPGDPNCELFYTEECSLLPPSLDPWDDPQPDDPYTLPPVTVTGCRPPLIELADGSCVDLGELLPPDGGGSTPPGGGGTGTTTPVADPPRPKEPKAEDFECGPPELLALTPEQKQDPSYLSWAAYSDLLAMSLWSIHAGDLATEAQAPLMQNALQVLSDYVFSGGVPGLLQVTEDDFAYCRLVSSCADALKQYYRRDLDTLTTTRCDLNRPKNPPKYAGNDFDAAP